MDADFSKILNKRAEADVKEREARQMEDAKSLSEFIGKRDEIMTQDSEESRRENMKAGEIEEQKRLDKARKFIESFQDNVQSAARVKSMKVSDYEANVKHAAGDVVIRGSTKPIGKGE